jgi:HlyD family secretion protein
MNRKRSSRKAIVWIAVGIVVVGAGAGVAMKRKGARAKGPGPTVKVERGQVVEKALAVGSIVPRDEVTVKAKVSGVVKRITKEPGQRVLAGEPLLEIQPDPTPVEQAEARRKIDMDQIAFDNRERAVQRTRELATQGMVPAEQLDDAERDFEQARLQLATDRELLELLEKGHVSIAGREIDALVKSPISGFVLEKNVNLGDPVVPLTSYQAGTVLMTLANMDSLVFKGTVDEIDVGKLTLDMPVQVKVGAIPDRAIPGRLTKISLKAREENNTHMFPVEIGIADSGSTLLRAGYSANADIIIRQVDSVLTIPERVVYAQGDSSWVEIAGPNGARERRPITTGLSDAVKIEVKSGLTEGQEVLEKPEKKL